METSTDAPGGTGVEGPPQNARKRILVVDDDPVITTLTVTLLKRDYDVMSAADGATALAAVSFQPFDLVLLDITMPGMDGIALCRILKTAPRTHDIPVIFISGHTDDGQIVLGFAAGGVDYVTKPFDTAVLRARISTHLALKDSRAALERAHHDLQEELSWAGELQRRLLAIEMPEDGPVRFSVGYEPLPDLHCGGDYYDVFSLASGRRLVILGDVSGHGLRAAFITVMLKSIIYRGYVKHHRDDIDLPSFVEWLNDRLCDELERLPGIFVAFLAFLIDPAHQKAEFCNAGQHPPCIVRGQHIIPVPRRGASLGFSREMLWTTDEVALKPGDRIVAYTDGLIEIGGGLDGGEIGEVLRVCSPSEAYASAVLTSVKERARRAAFSDDATVVSALIG